MPDQINLNVRVSGELSQHVARNVGEDGNYENTSEYIRSLIRQDKERAETKAFEQLKMELKLAFAQDDADMMDVTARDVIYRNKNR